MARTDPGKTLAEHGVVAKRALKRLLPWWLHGNEEICADCGATHASRAGQRCAGCDRTFCAACIEAHEREHYCAECLPRRRR